MGDSIQQWCEAARAGDQEAAAQLVRACHPGIFAFLRRLCGSDDDAADLTQLTFASAWKSLAAFGGRSSFKTWLHSIARHVYLDWRRRGNRLEFASDAWWECQAQDEPGPADAAATHQFAHWVYSVVDKLPEDLRLAIHLHYYQELTLQETASVLEVSTGTVKNRLREALAKLRARTEEELSHARTGH